MLALVGCTSVNPWLGIQKARHDIFQKKLRKPNNWPKMTKYLILWFSNLFRVMTALEKHKLIASYQEINASQGGTEWTTRLVLHSMESRSRSSRRSNSTWGHHLVLVVWVAASFLLDTLYNPGKVGQGFTVKGNSSWPPCSEPMAWYPKSYVRRISENPIIGPKWQNTPFGGLVIHPGWGLHWRNLN